MSRLWLLLISRIKYEWVPTLPDWWEIYLVIIGALPNSHHSQLPNSPRSLTERGSEDQGGSCSCGFCPHWSPEVTQWPLCPLLGGPLSRLATEHLTSLGRSQRRLWPITGKTCLRSKPFSGCPQRYSPFLSPCYCGFYELNFHSQGQEG